MSAFHPSPTSAWKSAPRRTLLALLAAVLSTTPALAREPSPPRELPPTGAWHELRTPNFRVLSQAPRAVSTAMLRTLEELRTGLLAPLRLSPETGPVDVVLFADREAYGHFVGQASVAKTSWRTRRPLMLLSAKGPTEGPHSTLLAHELSHALSHARLGRQPRWVAEGLAETLEGLEVHTRGAPFAALPALHVSPRWSAAGAERLLSLEALWAWDRRLPPRDQLARYYDSAWAWTSFLRHRHPREFAAFYAALGRGTPAETAFARAFAAHPAPALWAEAQAWVGRGRVAGERWELPALLTPEPQEAPLAEVEVRVVRAWLRLLGFDGQPLAERRRLAEAELDRAREVSPRHPGALRLRSQLDGDWESSDATALSELR